MGVLVRFDAAGAWQDTWVCDDLLTRHLGAHGLGWGRWPVKPLRAVTLAQVRKSYAEEIAALDAPWRAFDAVQGLRSAGVPPPSSRVAERAELHFFSEGVGLFYFAVDQGYLGLLCEAGEWVAWSAGQAYRFDAGEAPQLRLLRLDAPADGLATPLDLPILAEDLPLPSFDDFVEHMLELTGNEAA